MYTLKKLCNKAFNELLDSGLSYNTVSGANWYIWNRLVRKYGDNEIFKEYMVSEYCYEYFDRDIYSIDKNKLSSCEAMYVKAFKNLILSNKDIPFNRKTIHFKRDYKLSDNLTQLLNEYIVLYKSKGNSIKTLANKQLRTKNFIIDCHFETITKANFILYLNKRKMEMNKLSYIIEIRLIRLFLVFCYEKGVLDKEILLACPTNMCSISDKYIPSIYSPNEIKELLKSAKAYQLEENHLRNFAILSLISYSGIRANDVTNLKLTNINWRTNEIRFIQEKTKRSHIIPLISEIGNPILDYIRSARISTTEYLFISKKGTKLTPASITSIVNIYFSNSPIDIKGRHHGAHALRHSLATNLINQSVPAFSVANVLGHSSSDCIHIYAKVNLINLRKCILEAPYHV